MCESNNFYQISFGSGCRGASIGAIFSEVVAVRKLRATEIFKNSTKMIFAHAVFIEHDITFSYLKYT